jgi:hypothetical protein
MGSVFRTTRKGGLNYRGRSIHHEKLITKKGCPYPGSLSLAQRMILCFLIETK